MSLVRGGCIHDGEFAKTHNLPGICSESEWGQIKRDLVLAEITGVKYHVCHISAKESVQLIREAKARGVDVTCETAPHYLVLCDRDLKDEGRFKMNPPIRAAEDRDALIEGILDGTIDMIATDHAPHSAEEKSRGLLKSMMGVVGLECAFPVMYTNFVKTGRMSLDRLVELMHTNPSQRFGIGNPVEVGQKANFCVYDLNESYKIDPETFKSAGRATPLEGMEVFGKCKLTIVDGRTVHSI
jgi:dihydroorotase